MTVRVSLMSAILKKVGVCNLLSLTIVILPSPIIKRQSGTLTIALIESFYVALSKKYFPL